MRLTVHKILTTLIDFIYSIFSILLRYLTALLEFMFLRLTSNTKVDRLQAAAIGYRRVCSYFEELLNDALVIDSGYQIQSCITRHIWRIDNLIHEFRQTHGRLGWGRHVIVLTVVEGILYTVGSTSLTDDKL